MNKPSYTIGLDPTFYGTTLMGLEPNVQGFMIDLLKEIGKSEGININIVEMSPMMQSRLLRDKKIDAVVTPMSPYEFNKAVYDFSDLFLKTGPVLVLPAQSKAHRLDQLGSMEIATISGSDGALILEKFPEIIIRTYDLVPNALMAILSMQVDGALIDSLVAEKFVQDIYQGLLKVSTHPLSDAGLRLASLKGTHASLLDRFNNGLRKMEKSKKYKELLQKWSLS